MIWEVRLELAPERADMEVLRAGWERSSLEGCESMVRSGAVSSCKIAEAVVDEEKKYQDESLAGDTLAVGGIVDWRGAHEHADKEQASRQARVGKVLRVSRLQVTGRVQ